MGKTTEDLKKYATGFVVGAALYHYVIRPKYPSLPALNGLDGNTAQRLIRENSILRTEMNKAMQKLAVVTSDNRLPIRQLSYSEQAPDPNRNNRSLAFGFMANREKSKAFGFMDGVRMSPEAKYNPDRYVKEDRQRHFGAMRPYNAAGFDQSTVRTDRETRFGFAGPRSPALNPWGMW